MTLNIHAWNLAVAADLDATLEPALVAELWTLVEPHVEAMRAMAGLDSLRRTRNDAGVRPLPFDPCVESSSSWPPW